MRTKARSGPSSHEANHALEPLGRTGEPLIVERRQRTRLDQCGVLKALVEKELLHEMP